MLSTIFHDDDGTQMKVYVNLTKRVVIEVGNLFDNDGLDLHLIVLDDEDIDLLIKELKEQKRLLKLL